jgi:hypothetical protein
VKQSACSRLSSASINLSGDQSAYVNKHGTNVEEARSNTCRQPLMQTLERDDSNSTVTLSSVDIWLVEPLAD